MGKEIGTPDVVYDRDKRLVFVRMTGFFDLDRYENVLRWLTQSGEVPSDTPAIWDMTDMDFSDMDLAKIEKIRGIRAPYTGLRSATRIAMMVPQQIDAILTKLILEQLIGDSSLHRIVRSRQEAETWCLMGMSD